MCILYSGRKAVKYKEHIREKMHNDNIIEQYYHGIAQQLHAEVNFINALFQHQGLKGEGNEQVLRELLTKFIPKKYGVGTGVVIDRLGRQSRQCDIVIYDTFQYPSLLSLASVHLFPVDIVYATIEVKTTLNSEEAKSALANIASVKSLSIIEEQFSEVQLINGILHSVSYSPHSPLGFIFAYNSDPQKFETFKNWFVPKDGSQTPNFPTAIGCLDQGIVKFGNLYPQEEEQPEGWAIPLHSYTREDIPDTVPLDMPSLVSPDKLTERDKKFYPVKTFKVAPLSNPSKRYDTTAAIDPSRVLLVFILLLNDLLSKRRINPKISFFDHYLTFYTKSHLPQ